SRDRSRPAAVATLPAVARLRLAGLVLGVAVVLYIPAVAVWATVGGGGGGSRAAGATNPTTPTTTTTQKGSSTTRARRAMARGPEQTLHVAVPGTHTTRAVLVYRPDVPDSVDLPVLYVLHGSPGSATDPFDAGLPQVIDRLVSAGYPPFVLAAPDGNGTKH